jgi:glycerol-3-phosphate acyltransferase PlsY
MSLMETFIGGDVSPLTALGVLAAGYALGCFSTGYYLVRNRTGMDIRELGSGSTGARNAGRVLGRQGFWLTMGGDMVKGGLTVWLTLALTGNYRLALLALLAVVAGHVWPAQLGFRGGKGVSTAWLLRRRWR